MDDRTRRLLGVYDRLTRGVNPLADDAPADADASDGGGDAEHRFGVVGDASGSVAEDPEAEDGAPANDVVTVDDLWYDDEAASADAADAPGAPGETPLSAAVGPAVETDADGYATDLVIFEWLTMLIDTAGPAGALRAVDHYERMGWIDAEMRSYLESVLGGPALDVDVDPTEPGELAVADHERSYGYVRRLAVLREFGGDGEPTPNRERGP